VSKTERFLIGIGIAILWALLIGHFTDIKFGAFNGACMFIGWEADDFIAIILRKKRA